MINIIRKIKNLIVLFLGIISYRFYKNSFKILSIEDTLELIKTKSLIRFGDGEIALIFDKPIVYQNANPKIKESFLKVLNSYHDSKNSFILTLPDVFHDLSKYKITERFFYFKFLYTFRNFFFKSNYLLNNKEFGNTFVSRPYMIYKDSLIAEKVFTFFVNFFSGKNIYLIEGEFSRTGVGNDLLSKAAKVNRIICPSKNAFNQYNKIYNLIKSLNKSSLYLFAVGPTSKILIYNLSKLGFHCIDIGHLDSEYEWFLKRAKTKTIIDYKHTAEFNDNKIADLPLKQSIIYKKEILIKIHE